MNSDTKNVKASEVTFIDGSKDIVIGEVRLFNTNACELLSLNKNHFNINNVLSVKPIDIEVCNKCGNIVEETELYCEDRVISKQKNCPKCNLNQIPPLKK
ncbi:hypothetical protein [Bacillus cereus group sp. N21]|uniref:hypothetical protein n=1 Tax=Bacillus cereus group sp. N21 TaxID=2794591 RepID=UPI0018F4EDAB|nr:hypothetical protein [Bacillus cereus group sp. N21]MBJ8027752.1 hypothetical protein [Bacillus cereus group sp. N21]